MNTTEGLAWLKDQAGAMRQHVVDWANINSGSYHLAGCERMADSLEAAFAHLNTACQRTQLAAFQELGENFLPIKHPLGPLLIWQKRPEAAHQVLLTGHYDTVFGSDDPFKQCKDLGDGRINGPGVTDMKGGLCVILYTLLALEQSDWAENIGWQVWVNSDEEVGSPSSAPRLPEVVAGKDFALVFEPAITPEGAIVTTRKGVGKFTILVTGKAAHAGRAFDQGVNAITALSGIMMQVAALNGQRPGVTINLGRVHGGGALNIVAEHAAVHLDIRYKKIADQDWIENQLKQIMDKANQQSDLNVELTGTFGRPPKVMTGELENLIGHIQRVGKDLGLTIDTLPSGGCCDGNNIAALGLPVVDSMGVRGGGIHSSDEMMIVDSLVERAKLTYALLSEFARNKWDLK
jgi:glutamate carboxypeptidase